MTECCVTEITLQIKTEPDEDQNIDENNHHSNLMIDNVEEMMNIDNISSHNNDNGNQQSLNNSLCIESYNQESHGSIKSEFNIEELLIKTEYHSDNENEKIYENNHHSYISLDDGNYETINNDYSDKDPLANEQYNQCHVCEKKFKKKSNLKAHLLMHTGEKPYHCNRCDRKFVYGSSLKSHLLTHIRNDRYECHICGKLLSKRSLENHLLTHTDERPYQCEICNKKFKSKASLRTHLWTKHTVNKILHHCNVCGKMFWKNEDLVKHSSLHAEIKPGDENQKTDENDHQSNVIIDNDKEMTNTDNKNDDTNYNQHSEKNKFCTGVDNQETSIKVEIKDEEFLYIGNQSDKIIENKPSSISLRDRRDRPINNDLLANEQFQCHICDKKIRRKETFERHLYLHVAEKTYQCNRCDRKFVYKSGLKQHQLSHIRDKCYPCNICGRKFAKTHSLERHSLVHTDEKPYQCDICNYKFKTKSYLRNHLSKKHTVKKILHHCNICGKLFWRNEDLEKHSSLHTGSDLVNDNQKTCENNYHSNKMIDNNVEITKIGNKNVDITDNNQELLDSNKNEFNIEKICLKIENHSYENSQHSSISLDDGNNELINNNSNKDPFLYIKYKKFPCNICKKTFKKKWGLKTHLLIHVDKKSHDCNICKRKFIYKTALNKHYLSHFDQSNISTKFKLNQNLKLHSFVHTNKKSYHCNICNYKFKTRFSLKNHLSSCMHAVKKLNQCHICNEDFLTNEELEEHFSVHADDKFNLPNVIFGKTIEETCLKIENHSNNEDEMTYENNQHSSISFHDLCNNETIINDKIDENILVNEQCNSKFQCNICKKKFKQERNLEIHLYYLHFADKPHRCRYCDKKFICKKTLKKHLLSHIRKKRHQCNICGKKFTQKQLEFHSTVHNDDKPYQCNICNRKYKLEQRLKAHLTVHNAKKLYQCLICNEEFSTNEDLKGHFPVHAESEPGDKEQKLYENDQHSSRSLRYSNYQRIRNDNQQCNNKFECHICKKKLMHKQNLKIHLDSHFAERTHHCNRCDKKFLRKTALQDHLLCHKRNDRFECHICGKKFTEDYLKAHLFTHTDEKPYQCNICNRKFKVKGTLRCHLLKIHTVNKILHNCDICGKMFWRNEDLVKHSTQHADEENILSTRGINQELLDTINSEFNTEQLLIKTENHSNKGDEEIYENNHHLGIPAGDDNNQSISNDNDKSDRDVFTV